MMISPDYLKEKFALKFEGIIHIGANLGQEIEQYSRWGIKDVVLVEPITPIFEVMEQHIKNYPNINTKCYNVALGNDNKIVEMFISNNQGQSSSILQPKIHLDIHPEVEFFQQKLSVQMTRLDELDFDKTKYNMIVIDVQGYELEVFKGSTETLKNIDYIYSEVNNDYVYDNNGLVTEIDEFLLPYGFERVETYWANGNLPWGDALYIKKKI